MGKRWLIGIGAAIALAIGYFIVYPLGILFEYWQPLVRPAGVSARAQYYSSFENSFWFDCSIDQARNVNPCRVWDHGGSLKIEGDFRYEDEPRAATKEELQPTQLVPPDEIRTSRHSLYRVGRQVRTAIY